MIDLRIGDLVDAFNHVSTTAQAFRGSRDKAGLMLDVRGFADLLRRVRTLGDIAATAELPIIENCTGELIDELNRATTSSDGKKRVFPAEHIIRTLGALNRVQEGCRQELRTRLALIVDNRAKKLWEPREPLFGTDFKTKFVSAEYDLDEAAKCSALGRSTAAVFHLMRIMEIGLGAVHSCLGINVQLVGNDRNWGNILNRIRDEIKRRGKWSEHDLFQEMYALLDAVKDSWRNTTMHVEKKYTPEEADRIFNVVHGFMAKVASRMDEQGEPKA